MTSAWNEEWRRRRLPALAGQEWDLIVVGGGISGAGILREAARRGWRCLLLEQRDFAWAPRAARRRWSMAACATSPRASGG
ncbi:FAD dependent oxidoreductase family protein [Pseudomonas aeruginosa]|nr:FAD dependent oxidoreductase family protein [Pseudomonas aeruginosa]